MMTLGSASLKIIAKLRICPRENMVLASLNKALPEQKSELTVRNRKSLFERLEEDELSRHQNRKGRTQALLKAEEVLLTDQGKL